MADEQPAGDTEAATHAGPGSASADAGYPHSGAERVSPAAADQRAKESMGGFESRPEVYVAGAFAGAFVFAKVLKRLSGGG